MMEYRNDSVRRQDRLLGEERAREVLRGGDAIVVMTKHSGLGDIDDILV